MIQSYKLPHFSRKIKVCAENVAKNFLLIISKENRKYNAKITSMNKAVPTIYQRSLRGVTR
jgi:hypothetical protein